MDENQLAKSKDVDTKAQQEKEKELKKKQKKEQKRANKIVLSPFKSLLYAALIFMIIGFIFFFFGSELDIVESGYRAFLIFSTVYVGIGLLVLIFFYGVYRLKTNENNMSNSMGGSFDDDEDMERIINETEEFDQ
jgi:cation transport ATPase